MNSYGIFLPCVEERTSLLKTLQIISKQNNEPIRFYIITDCEKTRIDILNFLKLNNFNLSKITCQSQTGKYLSGALKTAIQICEEKYFILMASDLETDPYLVKNLINQSKLAPDHIVTVSRWKSGSQFKSYGATKQLLNFIFQKITSYLYNTELSDLTFGYRLYPSSVLKSLNLKSEGHSILLESLLVPLRKKIPVCEIPGDWLPREEGVSKKNWKNNFTYIKLVFLNLLSR